ncbi:MAG TPA: hypothetical protein VGO25_02690 [Rhodanobacteraceae bacterium]|jgi:hypothetical protein|nr:hypothetical protein [Rhodanobacteraceae bacterium]
MTAPPAVIDLLLRLGAELDFDAAKDVRCEGGAVDVVWFDRCLPLAAIDAAQLDLREVPALPIVAFIARTAALLEAAELAAIRTTLEETRAPLRILVIGRDSRASALAPTLQSVDQLRRQDGDAALRTRISESLRSETRAPGRTIAMLQNELVEWARRLREARPRSYSAETLFNRTGAID